jgi:hypothetical protein
MGWEKRGSGLYYYTKRREGRRVVSEYVGRGELAEAIATLDALDRERRELERQAERHELEEDRAVAREVDAICGMTRTLMSAMLLSIGYHTHKGQWRRRRE